MRSIFFILTLAIGYVLGLLYPSPTVKEYALSLLDQSGLELAGPEDIAPSREQEHTEKDRVEEVAATEPEKRFEMESPEAKNPILVVSESNQDAPMIETPAPDYSALSSTQFYCETGSTVELNVPGNPDEGYGLVYKTVFTLGLPSIADLTNANIPLDVEVRIRGENWREDSVLNKSYGTLENFHRVSSEQWTIDEENEVQVHHAQQHLVREGIDIAQVMFVAPDGSVIALNKDIKIGCTDTEYFLYRSLSR